MNIFNNDKPIWTFSLTSHHYKISKGACQSVIRAGLPSKVIHYLITVAFTACRDQPFIVFGFINRAEKTGLNSFKCRCTRGSPNVTCHFPCN